jgi:ATP-dependent helicase STH1/SNF2
MQLQASLVRLPAYTSLTQQQVFQLKSQISAYKMVRGKTAIPSALASEIQRLSPDQWQHRVNQNRGSRTEHPTPNTIRPRTEVDRPCTIPLLTNLERELEEKLSKQSPLAHQIQAELELVHILKLQGNFRHRIFQMVPARDDATFEVSHLDRSVYRRLGSSTQRTVGEQRNSSYFEKYWRNGQDLRKLSQHREFVTEFIAEQASFFEFQRKKNVKPTQQTLRRLAKDAKGYIDSKERRKQGEQDREQKQRLQMLKTFDMDAYIEMINKTKNERLFEILQQTDNFLRQLGAKVKVQKGNEAAEEDEELVNEAGDSVTESLKQSSKMYFQVTHSIHEEIKEQPRGLEGGTLKSYQLQGLQWLVSLYNNNLHGILADEMGLGKTIQTIALFQYLIEVKKNNGPFLVVVPLSTLSNWVLEFNRWAPSIEKVVYKGNPTERRSIIQSNLESSKFNVMLTTYEYIIKDKQQLTKIIWSHIVVDEGHRMKNSKSKFAQILGLQYTSGHRLLLTGTPLQNNLAELWSLLNFLLPKIFNSQDDFEKWFNQPISKMCDKQVELNEEENLLIINRLHQVLRPFLLRRVKKEVETELPDKVENVLRVEISAWQRILYRYIQDAGYSSANPLSLKLRNLSNSVMQLRKVCNHPYLFLPKDVVHYVTDEIWRCSGKFELLDRILPKFVATKHKVLIFCQMTQLMNIMQNYFDFRGYRYLRLDGATKADDRDSRMELFNSPTSEYNIFLLSTRAGGLGLNLQTADTVVLFDSDWNPQMDLQAQDRAHRIGQRHEVRVYRLVTNTVIEEEILTRAAYKKMLDVRIIQAGLFNNKSTDKERREKLQAFMKKEDDEGSQDEELLGDEQLNSIIARNEQEFELFESLDRERERREPFYIGNRLIQDIDSLPSWLKIAVRAKQEEDIEYKEYGRGARSRNYISYKDEGPWGAYADRSDDISNSAASKRSKSSDDSESFVESEVDEQSSMIISIPRDLAMQMSDSEAASEHSDLMSNP